MIPEMSGPESLLFTFVRNQFIFVIKKTLYKPQIQLNKPNF